MTRVWTAVQTGDCDDADARVSHLQPEVPYDGFDNDCDGDLLLDVDRDGYSPITRDALAALNPKATWPTTLRPGRDCDDNDSRVRPEREEVWYNDVDDNCDGLDDYDRDGDGYASLQQTPDGASELPATDCDDNDPNVKPGQSGDVPDDGVDTENDTAAKAAKVSQRRRLATSSHRSAGSAPGRLRSYGGAASVRCCDTEIASEIGSSIG